MNVLFIGKFPPIQGGTATAAFWRVQDLKKQGINFEVVTAILDSSEYLIRSPSTPDNVHIITESLPWHIPYSQLYSERLIAKAVEIAKNKHFDLIEGCYLFPYGFAAFIVSQILNKPLLLRHAGSDLYRISKDNNICSLLSMMLNKATTVTNAQSYSTLKSICPNAKIVITERYMPNPNVFRYTDSVKNKVSFFGKVTEKWDRKQLDFFYKELKTRNYKGDINIYSNEYTIKVFEDFFRNTEYKINHYNFVMPDCVPLILSNTKYLLVSKIPSGIPEESNIYIEGISSGCTPICQTIQTINDSLKNNYSSYLEEQINLYNGITD